MGDSEWDNEVNEEQDQFNTAKFEGAATQQMEREEELEEKELQQAKELKKLDPISKTKQVEDLGFTAKREARKKAERAASKIHGNSVKKVPEIGEEDEEEIAVPKLSGGGAPKEGRGKIQDPELAEFFADSEDKKFSEQAVDFLNAYWGEVGDQAEFIFSAAYMWFVKADMHTKGVQLQHLYEEGKSVEYNVAAYFYEKLYYWLNNSPEGKKFRDDPVYAPSMLQMKTAIQLKKDFREKVDVSFDGRISFLEHLLYQYNTVANPEDFMKRRKAMEEEHEVIRKARIALEDINEQIRKYEAKRTELEEGSKQPGVKGLGFKHELSMLDASPLAEALQASLISAEAAVRLAVKHYKGQKGGAAATPQGALFWMKRELQKKKEVVVPNTLRRARKG